MTSTTERGTARHIQDGMLAARRVVRNGTRKAEDLAYATAGEIRNRPFSSVGAAFVAGAALAGVITWLMVQPRKR